MMKRTLSLLLALCMALTLTPAAFAAGGTAYASTQDVELDGKKASFQAYALKDPATGYPTNYVKLRDVAFALSGTPAQFEVSWDGAVNLVTGKAYTANGSENKTPFSGDRAYTDFTGETRVNGKKVNMSAITLTDDAGGGYTYYKLRDLGNALGFGVDWTAERGIIVSTALDEEVVAAKALGIVPDSLSGTVTFAQFAEMLGNVIEKADAAALREWNSIAATALKTTDAMERDDGILALYEAACVLGLGKGTYYWNSASQSYSGANLNDGYSPRRGVFSNESSASPFEDNPGRNAGWDYPTSAMHFARGQSSVWNISPYFAQRSTTVKYSDPLTNAEAIKAAYRLYLARASQDEGSFDISDYETDWSDPLLKDAKTARDTILSSKTTITKSTTFTQGETYTGTAYYVSNSGNDSNDGKSPETAWATMKKVTSAKLNYGDAVFFERGGVWYTGNGAELRMQTGVTYSAYGTGAKPIWTGSPLDMANSAKWTLYKTMADGGKIWKYTENLPDGGIMLLNGTTVGRKAYPLWNGSRYVTKEGEPFNVDTGLTADLMFFSHLDLTGQKLPVDVAHLHKSGPLYFRCDAGNPGEIFDSIELAVGMDTVSTADGGYNTIDNISTRCYPTTGLDCNNHDNIIFQNCESCWCGGGVLICENTDTGLGLGCSGAGLALFGSNVTGRNNYIHDCESKGIAVVINGEGHSNLNREHVLAEGNVVERCGSSIYFMVELVRPGATVKFGDVHLVNNWFIDSAYGWRIHNQMWWGTGGNSVTRGEHCEALTNNNITPTGEVVIENNLFYRAAGTLITFRGDDYSAGSANPTMRGNTYVQDKDQVLFEQREEGERSQPLGILASDGVEARFRQYTGDTTGKVIIK